MEKECKKLEFGRKVNKTLLIQRQWLADRGNWELLEYTSIYFFGSSL
jgi:hypothetical protein